MALNSPHYLIQQKLKNAVINTRKKVVEVPVLSVLSKQQESRPQKNTVLFCRLDVVFLVGPLAVLSAAVGPAMYCIYMYL